MSVHVLYRCFSDDALLYIGITSNPATRFRSHEVTKPWWAQVTSIRLEHFESRDELELAELAAIRAEQPRHNIARNRRSRYRVNPPHISLRTYSLEEVGAQIAPHLKSPKQFFTRRIKAGDIQALKVGRGWRMTEAQVAAAMEFFSNKPAVPVLDSTVLQLTPLSARRRRSS